MAERPPNLARVGAQAPVRVAHVITRLIVGGAQETALLAAALADRERFDPVLVTGPQTGSEGSLNDEARRRGVRLVVVPELVRQVSPLRDVAATRRLAQLFGELAVDVVHTNSSKAGIVGRLAARRAKVPGVVHTVHGWPFHDRQRAPVSAVWRTLERRAAPLTDRLVVVADADRRKGLAAGIGVREQYVTVRSGLELEQYAVTPSAGRHVRAELGIPPEAPVVGSVNRLSRQKDPVSVVDAFAHVLPRCPEARLLLVGDGPLRADVERRASDLGVASRVVLTGLRSDVPRLLQAMDVFVSASLWEGLPRTVIAAMASDVPVVATPADGVADVVDDGVTGLLAPCGRPDLIGHALVRVLTETGLAQRLTTTAAAQVREFGASRMVRELEAIYDEVRTR